MGNIMALTFAIALSSLVGCSFKTPPDCSKQPDLSELDAAERTALNDALARYGGRCKRQDFQCDISLSRNNKDGILVTIASVYPDKGSGQCWRAPGDQDLVAYTRDGAFIRRVMSL